jgi:actin related protein 2/3 complex subunit 1A/1B
MVKESRVDNCITVHAWNADRSLLAVCPNSNQVHIYKKPSGPDGNWDKVATLKEHDALVTDIAWAPNTNRIVTTAQDRNAYVWTLNGSEWKPMLVILRITAAATSAEWSPKEAKFAVGSGSKTVPICYYEEGNNFWVSKMLKGNQSTVLAVSWHPTEPLLATASTDFKCRIFSAWLKNLDGKGQNSAFGKDPKFGTVLFETPSYGWVLNVAFNPTGDTLAFSSQDSTVTFVDINAAAQQQPCMQALRLSELPVTQLLFLPDGALIGGGHCFDPLLFSNTNQGWTLAGKIKPHKAAGAAKTGVGATRDMWRNQANTGQQTGTALDSAHHNMVCGLQLYGSTFGGTGAEFTSSALDGKVVFWSRDELTDAMANLQM